MKKKLVLLGINILLIIMVIVIILVVLKKKEENPKISQLTEKIAENVESLKEETGAKGNSDIYAIVKEDDNEYLTVKDDILYKVALAGIIKKEKPTFEELDDILKEQPTKSGVWVSEGSRKKILEMINKLAKRTYSITNDGYITVSSENLTENEIDKKINKMLNANHQYNIDISGTMYDVDSISGEIVEYPFEKMSPTQTYEYVDSNNKTLIILSTNKENLMTDEEIINSLLDLCVE